MSTIVVASIEVKPSRSVVVTTEGRRLGFFKELAATITFQIGGTYEVETKATEYDGKTLVNIVKAKQVAASPGPVQTPFVSGTYRNQSATSGPDTKSEQIFVQGILQAMIKAGKVEVDKQALWSATQMLRGLYKHTFGFDSVHQHLEAAE
jgi:hypothetical protein